MMKNKLKDLALTMLSMMIVCVGVGLTTFYLANKVSFLSIFLGLMGFAILWPAIDHYKQSIGNGFK
jgi:hypothetical protein